MPLPLAPPSALALALTELQLLHSPTSYEVVLLLFSSYAKPKWSLRSWGDETYGEEDLHNSKQQQYNEVNVGEINFIQYNTLGVRRRHYVKPLGTSFDTDRPFPVEQEISRPFPRPQAWTNGPRPGLEEQQVEERRKEAELLAFSLKSRRRPTR